MKNALILLVTISITWAVISVPYPIILTQPDGTTFQAMLKGDEWQNWYETVDGYTIMQDDSREWVFAKDVRDGKLISSDIVVAFQKSDPTILGLTVEKQLKPAKKIHFEVKAVVDLSNFRETDFLVPLLLIDYAGYPYEYPLENFDAQMNDPGWDGTGSFRDFYEEISYDQFHPLTTVSGWFTAEHGHDYYGDNQGGNVARELVREAVDAAEEAGFDWTIFDNDGDGDVDALNIIHAGPGAEAGGSNNIWSHRWSLGPYAVTYDGVYINDYTINPETYSGNQEPIGTIAHEFGHALNLPDLYDTDYSSEGSGNWSLMAGGAWGADGGSPWYPAHMVAWSKIELGWLIPELLTEDTSGLQLPPVETNPVVYQINHTSDNSEYFLLENRQKIGFDQNMFNSGLLIWHIDTQLTSGWGPNNNEPHYGVGLEQADGQYHLENGMNRGDGADPYPGATNNPTFDDDTIPNSHSYYFVPSLISVHNITLVDSFVVVDVQMGSDQIISADAGVGQGAAWDTGSVSITLDNDYDIIEFECLIKDNPNKLILTGVELTSRTEGMTLEFEEMENGYARVHLTEGIIEAGFGSIFKMEYFCNSGTSVDIELEMLDADAFNVDGEEIAVSLSNGIFYIYSEPQVLTVEDTGGSPGSVVGIPLILNSTVPLSMISFRLTDQPDVFSLFAEPFEDTNGNNQWDEGEPFTDTNSDGVWSDVVTLDGRLDSDWDITAADVGGQLMFTAVNWITPLEPGEESLLTLNVQVSPDADQGSVALLFSNILLIDLFGNNDVVGMGEPGTFTVTSASIDGTDLIPEKFALYQNYPNPFNPVTTISFDLPKESDVKLMIYDLKGRVLVELVTGRMVAGSHSVVWDASEVASGVYIYKLTAGDKQLTKKMILLK